MAPPPNSLREATSALAEALARPELDALIPEGTGKETLRRLRDRVGRDLVPRLGVGEGAPALLVGIAGPNNVGKSSLFNALAGKVLSPARAEGGLTKQCLATCHPSLLGEPLRAFLSRRYQVVEVEAGQPAPVDQPGPSGRLYLAPSEEMPRGLLLLDTPDFDSLYRDNRVNAEALLVTVDLVLFVVSRQTYQNAALVEFLAASVSQGRPWAVLYNEATKLEVARGHLDKLASDVGHAPVARFFAEHQPDVEEGRALLRASPLDEGGRPLFEMLRDEATLARWKALALEASLKEARRESQVLAEALGESSVEPSRLAARLRHELSIIGGRAALKAVPADVLVQAFRDELDARSVAHRWVRRPFRGLATALSYVGRELRKSFVTESDKERGPTPALQTEETLKDGLRVMAEALAPELAAWRGDEKTRALLQESLGTPLLHALARPLGVETKEVADQDRAALYRYSRKLVDEELPRDGREEVIQALTTLVYSVPTGAAAVATVVTGGLGHDVIIWGGTLLSTPLLEKFVDLLGHGVRARVTKKWAEEHGASLAKGLEAKLFQPLLSHLDAQTRAGEELAAKLRRVGEALTGGAR